MKHHNMQTAVKAKYTNIFTHNGGVFENFEDDMQGWLVPSSNRPGHRTAHLFQHTESGWQYCEITTSSNVDCLELSQKIKNTLKSGVNPVLPEESYTDYLLQDMLYKAEDRQKSIIYGFFLLPSGWRSHGTLQLFYKRPRDKSWAYLRNYSDLDNVLTDKTLSNNVRNQIRKQARRQTA